jgi:hypothetical protein
LKNNRSGDAVGDFVETDRMMKKQAQMEKTGLKRQFAARPQALIGAETIKRLVIVIVHRRQPRRAGVAQGHIGFPRQLLRGLPQPLGAKRLTLSLGTVLRRRRIQPRNRPHSAARQPQQSRQYIPSFHGYPPLFI